MIEVPVLISGGGPVGLTLALALSRQGVRSLVVNDRKETTTHPKLDVVNCRSMEIFRQLGVAEKIRAAGNPLEANQYAAIAASANGPFYNVMKDRHFIYQSVASARQKIRACTDGTLPLESMQRIAQMHLEPVLLEEAKADPNIEVRFGWRLYGFEQDSDGVTALAMNVDTGANQNVRAQYLIGCDGPNSRVRNFLNIDYDGTRDLVGELFIIHLRSDEIAGLFPNRQPYWHTWLSRPHFTGLLVSPNAARNDYIIHRMFAPRNGETIESVVDSALGTKLKYEIVQSGPWRPQFLAAESFGRGRVYLAGDATHQYMPTGGLGMNTGVGEAHNLAWKLAARIHGWGGEKLLESYDSERRPIAFYNRDHAKRCAAAVFESQFLTSDALLAQGPAGDAARAEVGAEFERKVSRLYESMGVEFGYRYRESPVICRDPSPEPAFEDRRFIPTTFPGARLPSGFMDDGSAVFDQLDPKAFTLLAIESGPVEIEPMKRAAVSAGVPLRVLPIHEPHLAKIYEKRFVMVRPDQHVCWRGDRIPEDCAPVINTIRGAN